MRYLFRHSYLHLTRSLIVVWMLVFVLGSLAHAGHDHEKEQSRHQTCEYCVSFAHMGGGATALAALTLQHFADELPITFDSLTRSQRSYSIAQARAPPAP